MARFAIGRAPTRPPARFADPQLGDASALGAPGQRFHNVKPPGGGLGDAEDVGHTSFFKEEGDSKGAILLGDLSSLLGALGTANPMHPDSNPRLRKDMLTPTQTLLQGLGAPAVATVINVTKGTAGNVTYKDYATSDGYTFRRFDNTDDIHIVKSPISKKETVLSSGNAKTKVAWTSVDALLDAADKGTKPPPIDPAVLVAAIQGGAAVTVATLEAVGGKHKKKKHKKKGQDDGLPVPLPEPASTIPWVPLAIGGAGLLLVFMLMGKKPAA